MRSLSLYKTELLENILSANSQEDVKQLIEEAIELLKKSEFNNETVYQLVGKIIKALDLFSPLKKNAKQWSNIKIAKIQCLRIKKRLEILLPEHNNHQPKTL